MKTHLLTSTSESSLRDHPLPRRPWVTRLVVPIGLAAAALAVLLWAAWSNFVPARTIDGVPVVLETIEPPAGGSANPNSGPSVQAAGWVEPLPFPIYVTALTSGVIDEVLVLEGESVRKGQVVATLIREDAELALREARANRDRRAAEVAMAEAAAEQARANFSYLIGPRRALAVSQSKLMAAKAAIAGFASEEASARAMLGELDDEFQRKSKLVESGTVSAQELTRLRLRLEAQRAAVEALPARRQALEAAQAEATADLDAAKEALDRRIDETAKVAAAEAQLAAARADLDEADAALAIADLRLQRTQVRSPADGIVLWRDRAPGSMVGDGAESTVVSLFDPAKLQVRADVPNADIALVGVGMRAAITLETLPNRTLHGTVRLITGQADIQKNTVQIKIAIDDPPSELRPEMLCRVRIGGGEAGAAGTRHRLSVPVALLDGDRAMVASAASNGVSLVEERLIKRGEEEPDGWTTIREGLRPGDVLLDAKAVRPGERVRVRLPNEVEATHGTD